MTIYFTHPVFLWGAAGLVAALWFGLRRSALDFSTARMSTLAFSRTLIGLAVIFALAGLTLGLPSSRREAIFLIDASQSVDEASRQKVERLVDDVTSKDSTINVKKLYFAGRAANEVSELTAEDRNATNLEGALLTAFAAADPTCVSRVALFSDGVETVGDASQIASESVATSTIPLAASEKPETQVSELILPQRVNEGESFRARAVVRSSVATTGSISFFQNGGLISSREISVEVGENVYERYMTTNGKTKEIEVVATVETKEDTFVDNNSASGLTLADGKPRVLAIASEPTYLRNFVAALESQDFSAEVRPIEGFPSEVAGLKMLDGVDFDSAPPLLGNVVAKPKTTSEVALTTETGEPLLAHWRYGLGVAVAFTSDVDGRWSAEWFDWPDFSQFWAQILRFAARSKDSTSRLTVATKGNTATVSFDLRDRYGQFLNDAETKTVVVDGAQNRRELPTPQRGPGFYQVSFPTEPGVKYALQTTSVKNGETLATQSRVFVVPKGRETDVASTNEKALRDIAEKSTGAFDPTPEEFVASFANVGDAKVSKSLRGVLLCFALTLFVFDVYFRRFNSYKIDN